MERLPLKPEMLPPVRGRLVFGQPLAELSWLRVGGPAEVFFQPADRDDLCAFLAALPPAVPVFPMGVASNLIIRDGGIPGVVVRLGRGFNAIRVEAGRVIAGAAALDAHVALRAAEAGLDLVFLRTIPGSIGGAVRMNAGCYGRYVSDVLEGVSVVTRSGDTREIAAAGLGLGYRSSMLPPDWIVTEARFRPPEGAPEQLLARMEELLSHREATQPVRERTCGSTFRNPSGHSSTGRPGESHDLKAWKLIEEAGLRGLRRGDAQMSPMHANFLVNTGAASAAELEDLGEEVRKKVFHASGISLEWEIMRVGEREQFPGIRRD